MAKQKKQQNTQRIPPIQQIPSQKLRHHSNGKFKHTRDVSKPKMVTKTTKNSLIQTTKHDKIQIKMVWEKIHTNRQILSLKPKMQQLRIPKKRPNTQNTKMDMPQMWKTPPQRHKRCKKHFKRRTTNNKSYNSVKKNIFSLNP